MTEHEPISSSLVDLNRWLEGKAKWSERHKQFREAAQYWENLLLRLTRESEKGRVDVSRLAAIHYRLGLAHRALNDDEKSLYHLKYSVRLNSSEPRYFEAFGRAFLSGGHWRVAKAQFRKAIQLDPKNVTFLRQYASVLLMMDKKEDALLYAKKAYRLKRSDRECQLSLVRVYMELEKFTHALVILHRMRRTQKVRDLIESCLAKRVFTLEGAVLTCLRRGMPCDESPFNLSDIRQAEDWWTKYCLTFEWEVLPASLPHVWAAALTFLVVWTRNTAMDMEEVWTRYQVSGVEVWPRIRDLQEALSLKLGVFRVA